jgi:type I restriction enzyme S subunit
LLGTDSFYEYVQANERGASYPAIPDNVVKRFRIPVPPIEAQARIVSILDKFDALVNDLSSGLPAEIAARHKQYAHYRDRLLTFKEAV